MTIFTKEMLSLVVGDKVRKLVHLTNTIEYGLHKWDDRHKPEPHAWANIVFTINYYEALYKYNEIIKCEGTHAT